MRDLSSEELYMLMLIDFRKENNALTEHDFVLHEIQKIENAQMEYQNLLNISDSEIVVFIRNENFRDVHNMPNEVFNKYKTSIIDEFIKHKKFKTKHASLLNRRYLNFKLEGIENQKKLQDENSDLKKLLNDLNNKYEESLEIVNENKLSNNEKIVLLDKLGVIDFLRNQKPFTSSTNNLASVLALITEERSSTISATLRGMNTGEPKRDPYYNKNNLLKINSILLQKGFKVD